jgi:hypothetical protein
MTAQQATRAKEISPNQYGIPLPNGFVVSGTMLSSPPYPYLIEIEDAFILDLKPGDLVINTTQNTYTVVAAIGPGIGKVYIADDIMNASDTFEIWKKAEPESACILFVPNLSATSISVVTAGQDEVTFVFPANPCIIPVRVVKYTGGPTSGVIALW